MSDGEGNGYPGYDVMSKQWSDSWDEVTRATIRRRLSLPQEPRFFTQAEWATLSAVCDRIMPQPSTRPKVVLPALVDAKITEGHEDGYRLASLPRQGEAWKRGLAALEQEAHDAHGVAFAALDGARQDGLLRRMQQGELTGAAWAGMPCKAFFEHRVIADITHAYYGHPTSWSEIGFGGPASPRGYVRMGLDRRDPWEAVEAKPGQEDAAREANRRVG